MGVKIAYACNVHTWVLRQGLRILRAPKRKSVWSTRPVSAQLYKLTASNELQRMLAIRKEQYNLANDLTRLEERPGQDIPTADQRFTPFSSVNITYDSTS